MTRAFYRYIAAFTCQASAVVVAGAFSTGTQTGFDTLAGQNADGCDEAEIEIKVTTFVSVARCEVYMEALQHDGVGYAAPKLLGSVAIASADDYAVRVVGLSEKGRIIVKALDANFTAVVSMRGIYPADV